MTLNCNERVPSEKSRKAYDNKQGENKKNKRAREGIYSYASVYESENVLFMRRSILPQLK